MLESMFDDGTGVSRIAECQCTVVYDIRKHPTAAQYQIPRAVHGVPVLPDIAVVFHIGFVIPNCLSNEPGARHRIQIKSAIIL